MWALGKGYGDPAKRQEEMVEGGWDGVEYG